MGFVMLAGHSSAHGPVELAGAGKGSEEADGSKWVAPPRSPSQHGAAVEDRGRVHSTSTTNDCTIQTTTQNIKRRHTQQEAAGRRVAGRWAVHAQGLGRGRRARKDN